MSSFYFYLIAGITLLILELTTGTFYLLVIGCASIIASISALILHDWAIPSVSAAFLSVLGCFLIYKYKRKHNKSGMVVEHIGQVAEVTEIHASHIRVLYSGSYWDAKVQNNLKLNIGDAVRITKFSNHELEVESSNSSQSS